MMGDAVAVTRAGRQTGYYAVAVVGVVPVDAPSIVNPGYGTVLLTRHGTAGKPTPLSVGDPAG